MRSRIGFRTAAALLAAVLLGPLSTSNPAAAAAALHSEKLLFDGGGDALNGLTYHSFRIPSLVRTKQNTYSAR